FLKFVDFGRNSKQKYQKYLIKFIEIKYDEIGFDRLIDTLNILNSKRQYDKIYIIVLRKLRKLNFEFINNDIHINSIEIKNIEYDIPIFYNTLPLEKKIEFLKKVEEDLNGDFDTTKIFILLLEKIPLRKETKIRYVEWIHKRLETNEKVTKDDYRNYHFFQPIKEYFDLLNIGIIKDKELLSLNIKVEAFKFIVNPEKFDKDDFDIEWLKIFDWDSFLKRFSKIDYIIEKIENYLTDNNDEELNKLYFKILKFSCDRGFI